MYRYVTRVITVVSHTGVDSQSYLDCIGKSITVMTQHQWIMQ